VHGLICANLQRRQRVISAVKQLQAQYKAVIASDAAAAAA